MLWWWWWGGTGRCCGSLVVLVDVVGVRWGWWVGIVVMRWDW